jgi:hypothetical protein
MENRMKTAILLAVTAFIPSCITMPPVQLSAKYLLPGGKGVIEISTDLPRWTPDPQPDSILFPIGQK